MTIHLHTHTLPLTLSLLVETKLNSFVYNV